MERTTASFDKETAAAIRKAAGKRGVSAFLQQAARERLARLELIELLDELDATYGPPSAAEIADVEREAASIFGPLKRASRPGSRTRALRRTRHRR